MFTILDMMEVRQGSESRLLQRHQGWCRPPRILGTSTTHKCLGGLKEPRMAAAEQGGVDFPLTGATCIDGISKQFQQETNP